MKWNIKCDNFVNSVTPPKSFFLEEFDAPTLRAFVSCVNDAVACGQHVLPVYIETHGGSSFALNGFMSVIDGARNRGIKIATIVAGYAFSAGAFLFLYGDKGYRFLGSTATLMLHEAQLSELVGKFSEIKSILNSIDKLEAPFYDKINKHLGKKKNWLENQLNKIHNNDWFLTADEALSNGFTDHIHLPVFNLEIESKVTIT